MALLLSQSLRLLVEELDVLVEMMIKVEIDQEEDYHHGWKMEEEVEEHLLYLHLHSIKMILEWNKW